MKRVAVIGDRQSVLGFKAVGLEVYTPEDPEEAQNLVRRLAREGVGIVFITERMAKPMEAVLAEYDQSLTPAIILIPDHQGSLGIGKDAISQRVEKAVGRALF